MKILIVHEIDWIKKVPFEPHHLAEILSTKNNDVYVVDCAEPDTSRIQNGFTTSIINNYHRLYDDSSVTLIRPSSISVKGLNRLTQFLSFKKLLRNFLVENEVDLIFLYGVATNGIQCSQLSKELKKRNVENIFLIDQPNAIGNDNEATVDGVHFNDLG